MRVQIVPVSALLVALSVAGTLAQQPTTQRPGVSTGSASTAQAQDDGVLQGRVVDDRSGQPVAQALVSLSGADGETTATTDAEGRYALGGLLPGA